MKTEEAIYKLAYHATQDLNRLDASSQIAIYEALACVLPTPAERINAQRIATNLRETAELQLEFTKLFASSTRRKP